MVRGSLRKLDDETLMGWHSVQREPRAGRAGVESSNSTAIGLNRPPTAVAVFATGPTPLLNLSMLECGPIVTRAAPSHSA